MSAKERQKGKVTKDSVTLLPCFYFVELPILASSVVSLYFLELTDVFKPVHSGFNCYDKSLSMPYIEPTQESVPFLMLLSLVFAGPSITIMIGEGILYCCLSKRRNGIGTEANINAGGCNFNSFLRRAVRFVGVHVFGLCATALVTDIIQLSTGYQAPYFLTVCKPNYTSLNVSCSENSYVVEDICSGADLNIINAGRNFGSRNLPLDSCMKSIERSTNYPTDYIKPFFCNIPKCPMVPIVHLFLYYLQRAYSVTFVQLSSEVSVLCHL